MAETEKHFSQTTLAKLKCAAKFNTDSSRCEPRKTKQRKQAPAHNTLFFSMPGIRSKISHPGKYTPM